MKASPTVCAPTLSNGDVSASTLNGVSSGRVHKQRRDIENEEIQMYLSKLKELVPFMPKNKRLSKLEVIQHVIDYICDLQYALESHPKAEALISSALPTMTTAVSASSRLTPPTTQPRQPLGVLGVPNTIVPAGSASCSVQEQVSITAPPHLLEKVSTSDSRPVSC